MLAGEEGSSVSEVGGCWLVGGGARVSDFFLQRIQILKQGGGGYKGEAS